MTIKLEEIKQLILWAKGERIQTLTISAKGDISVEFSPLAFVGVYPEAKNATMDMPELGPETPDLEDTELLFHSST